MILKIFKMIPTMFCLILISPMSARPINITTESSPYAQPPEVFISNVLHNIIRAFGYFPITDSLIKAGDPSTIKMRLAINETKESNWEDQVMNEPIGSTEYIQSNHKYTDANTTGLTASGITKDQVLNETLMGTSVETTTLTNESKDELQHNYEYTEANVTELKESGITEEQVVDEKIFDGTTNETTITHLSESTGYIQNSNDYTDANTSKAPGITYGITEDQVMNVTVLSTSDEAIIIPRNSTDDIENDHEYTGSNSTVFATFGITADQNKTVVVGTSYENTSSSGGSNEYIHSNHDYSDKNTAEVTSSGITEEKHINGTVVVTSNLTNTYERESTDYIKNDHDYSDTNTTELTALSITENQAMNDTFVVDTSNGTIIFPGESSESKEYTGNKYKSTDANITEMHAQSGVTEYEISTEPVVTNDYIVKTTVLPESDEAKEAGLVDSFTEMNIIDEVAMSNETIEAIKTTDDGSIVSHSNKNSTEESSEIGGTSIYNDIRMQMKNGTIKKTTLGDIARSTTDIVENPILQSSAGGTDKLVLTTNKVQIPPTVDYDTEDSSESVETTIGRTESGKSTKSSDIPVPIDSVNETSPKVTNTEEPHQVNSSATETTSSTDSSIDAHVDKSFQAINVTKNSPTGVNNDTEDSSESVEYEYDRKENICSNTSNPDAPCGNDTVTEGQRHNETTANDIRKKNLEQWQQEEKERHERFASIVGTMLFVTIGMSMMAMVGCHYFSSICGLINDQNRGPVLLPVIAEEDEGTELLEIKKKTVEIVPAKQKDVHRNSGSPSVARALETVSERVPLCISNGEGPREHENKDQDSLKLEPLET